jgi:hypothetical protein
LRDAERQQSEGGKGGCFACCKNVGLHGLLPFEKLKLKS